MQCSSEYRERMYAITGLFFLFALGDAFGRTLKPDDVIWFPIEDNKNGFTSSYGYVYVDSNPQYYGYERRGRSVQRDITWNDFTAERDRSDDSIIFPFEDILKPCEDSCPRTPEYNPVCGSDGRTYHNMATLRCSLLCGHGVRFVHYGNCGKGLPLIFRPTPRPPRKSPTQTRSDDVNRYYW